MELPVPDVAMISDLTLLAYAQKPQIRVRQNVQRYDNTAMENDVAITAPLPQLLPVAAAAENQLQSTFDL